MSFSSSSDSVSTREVLAMPPGEVVCVRGFLFLANGRTVLAASVPDPPWDPIDLSRSVLVRQRGVTIWFVETMRHRGTRPFGVPAVVCGKVCNDSTGMCARAIHDLSTLEIECEGEVVASDVAGMGVITEADIEELVEELECTRQNAVEILENGLREL